MLIVVFNFGCTFELFGIFLKNYWYVDLFEINEIGIIGVGFLVLLFF